MSWLKSLNYKRFLEMFRQDSALERSRFSFVFRWNQPTKVVAGLLASIFFDDGSDFVFRVFRAAGSG